MIVEKWRWNLNPKLMYMHKSGTKSSFNPCCSAVGYRIKLTLFYFNNNNDYYWLIMTNNNYSLLFIIITIIINIDNNNDY